MTRQYATCNDVWCASWCVIPNEFDERIHFLRCSRCHAFMHPCTSHPVRELAFRLDKEVTPKIVNQEDERKLYE